MSKPAILINLNRCTGCWTCSLACKQGNDLPQDEYWQFVRTMNCGKGIDRPSGIWPNLRMEWMPIHTTDCTLCARRTAEGYEPYCVYNCSNDAMFYGDISDAESPISKKIEEFLEKGFKIFQEPEWERSNRNIYYVQK